MSFKKELYLSDSLGGLNNMIDIPNLKHKKAIAIARSANTVLTEAKKKHKEGDDELAYVFYMKYFGLLNFIKSSTDYAKEKDFVRKLLGPNDNVKAYMDVVATIQKSLSDRYEEKKSKNENRIVTNENNKREKSPEQEELDTTTGQQRTIECSELFALISDPSVSMLIMDCRPAEEFAASRILFKSLLNVPDSIICRGYSAGKLADKLNIESKKLWSSRSIVDRLILIDWCSNLDGDSNSPLWTLRNILENWDPDVQYKQPLQYVNGGYENFKIMYPMLTLNPNYTPKNVFEMRNIVEDIEYPSLSDIKMKDDTVREDSPFKNKTSRVRPNIDRSTKSAALKTHTEKNLVGTIYKEKEQLANKALEKEKEALKVEADLLETITRESATNDDTEKKECFDRQQELSYKLLQFDNERDDNITQQVELEVELESIEVDEQQQIEASLAAERIRQKDFERSQIEQKRKQLSEENERRLKLAREQKRHHKMQEDDAPLKPKQPMFDRTIKPITPLIPQAHIQRNFAPEYGSVGYGLTGLKNLGNTCYMNSILQCLSNLESLCSYFKSGNYKKHINRKSRSRGQIADEFAAVCCELWSGQYKSISAHDFRYVFGQYQKIFSGHDQQDSHEFLTILIDMLHSDNQITIEENTPIEKLSPSEKAWREFINNKQSFIMNLFYGQIRSTVKCRVCQQESATYEGFSNLSLELPQSTRQCDLEECLNMYFHGEVVNGWDCPKCKVKRDAIKKLDISKVPPFLVIHFKRFYADLDASSNVYKKKQNYIRFPIHNFDINDYVTNSAKRFKGATDYNLCAVSNHYGTMERGHYTAFGKNYLKKCWYKFDDNYVTQIDKSEVVSSAAYILFYSSL